MYKVFITKKEVYSYKFLPSALEKVKEHIDIETCENITYLKGFNVLECENENYKIVIRTEL